MSFHLVTGASRGLGFALAAALLRAGHEVAAASRSAVPDGLAALGGSLRWSRLDLADLDAARDWARDAVAGREQAGPVAVLLNAGMVEPIVPAERLDPAALDRHLRVNLASPMLVAGAAIAALGAGTGTPEACRVLAISSGAARYGVPYWGAYCAAKAGLDNFVRTLNAEADPANGGSGTVRAASLAPGVVDTAMQETIRAVAAPKRERFLALHRDGGLLAPEAAAEQVLRYLRRDDFGAHEIDDLREVARREAVPAN